MTNILATILISIVTNVTPSVEREVIGTRPTPCPDTTTSGPGWATSCLVYHYENIYGKEIAKTETTEVVEVRTLRASDGVLEYTTERRRVLSTGKPRRWKRQDNWTEEL